MKNTICAGVFQLVLWLASVSYGIDVTSTADSGAGSLRRAIIDTPSGETIRFNASLSGGTIRLTTGQLTLDKNLVIDASDLAAGITIDGNFSSRLFECGSGTTSTLINLRLVNGYATLGGVIYNAGTLVISNSTLSGSTATSTSGGGGGIYNSSGNLTINSSTLAGNQARSGGAIHNLFGTVNINNSTLAANTATGNGGGVYLSSGKLVLNQVTISGNSAASGGGTYISSSGFPGEPGGGVGAIMTATNTIVAGNSAASNPDYYGSFTSSLKVFTWPGVRLAPLGDYGGPTQTMPPLPDSLVVDWGSASALGSDQRGSARTAGAAPDAGAAEFQGADDLALFWQEDWDGDGAVFGLETALDRDPLVADTGATGTPVSYPPVSGNGISFGYNPAAAGSTAWVVKRSLDLTVTNGFTEIFRFDGPTRQTSSTVPVTVEVSGNTISVTDNTAPRPDAAFFRLEIELRP